MNLDPYSFIVVGRRLIRPQLSLIRAGNLFTGPNSFRLNMTPYELGFRMQGLATKALPSLGMDYEGFGYADFRGYRDQFCLREALKSIMS